MNQPLRATLVFLSAAAILVGCHKDETAIRTYSAPKDTPAPQVASADQTPSDTSDSPAPEPTPGQPILWTVPESWKQVPGGNQMRYATFRVSENDPKAELTVLRLPAEAAAVLPNVNRWAGQLKLPQVSQADLIKLVSQTQVSGEQAAMVDMTGSPDTGNPPTRLLAAIIPHEDSAWFFTLKAPAPVVADQKANFEKFLHSIQFPTGTSASADSSEAAGYKLAKWKTPEGWVEQPGSNSMRVTSFRVGPEDQHTEVIVSKIPIGGFGSIPDNLNRWRGQVGLPPVDRPDPDTKQEINVAGHGAIMMAFKGPAEGPTPARTALVAMDQEGREFWFIKMLGPDSVVSKQQDNFKQFLDSLQFEPESH
ncbi:MAG TPA: hypothetical protein VLJ39_19995 [Tepidisphaeraceae bacterium]|nr:hypothetical protein [Tepidisphaeraceae bacterium]